MIGCSDQILTPSEICWQDDRTVEEQEFFVSLGNAAAAEWMSLALFTPAVLQQPGTCLQMSFGYSLYHAERLLKISDIVTMKSSVSVTTCFKQLPVHEINRESGAFHNKAPESLSVAEM